MTGHENATRRRGAARRWVRRGGIAAAIVLAVPVLWIFAHLLFARSVPPAPFTEADLPVPPPPAGNGWEVLRAAGWTTMGARPPEAVDGALHGPASWEDVVAAAAEIGEARARLGPEEEVLRRALERRRFVDACPPRPDAQCPSLGVQALHRVAAVVVLDDALRGRFAEAFRLLARLVRADADYLGTARTLLANTVALGGAEQACRLVAVLAEGVRAAPLEGGPPPVPAGEAVSAAAELLAQVHMLDLEHADLSRGFVTESLLFRWAVERLGLGDGGGALPGPTWLFDPGRTAEAADGWFRAAVAWARDPSRHVRPAALAPRSGTLWWVWNRTGKLLLDLGGFGASLDRIGPSFERGRTEAIDVRDRAARALAELAAGTPVAGP